VQGDALGGGFEAALSCHTIVAESGIGMGFPEVLFDLYPGMGAYSFLCQRISPYQAEKLMLNGNIYSSDELYKMGLVDILVPRGEGVAAVEEVIRNHRRIPHARRAMHQVRQQVSLEEMMRITEIWVDTAMQLGEKSLRTMERLVKAQVRQGNENKMKREVV
jgi:DSF synthase